jgi:hypothetical protein
MSSLTSGVTDQERRPDEEATSAIEKEVQNYFSIPRHSCFEMVPRLVRLKSDLKRFERQRVYKIYYRQLQRARIPDSAGAMRHIIDLDKSDDIVPHGQVSKKMYDQLCAGRDFDLYGRSLHRKRLTETEEREMHELAARLGLEYETKAPPIEEYVKVPDIFENVTADIKVPVISTHVDKIGHEDTYHPPVGFATNPKQLLKSYGREIFFAYDGEWSKGKMAGRGFYQYSDGGNYKGYFKTNRPHGEGVSTYPNKSTYDGEWKDGKYCGRGIQTIENCSQYTGEMNFGRREGVGKLVFESGLEYEGEFLDGKPHGRGKMKSALTGWGYEGSFQMGNIEGSGVLITPENNRIVQYWPAGSKGKIGVLLPTMVKEYLQAEEDLRLLGKEREDQLYSRLRSTRLNEYVALVRHNLHEQRAVEKRDRRVAEIEKIKEQKRKLMEARLKALAGE